MAKGEDLRKFDLIVRYLPEGIAGAPKHRRHKLTGHNERTVHLCLLIEYLEANCHVFSIRDADSDDCE